MPLLKRLGENVGLWTSPANKVLAQRIPGARWDKGLAAWVYPFSALPALVAQFRNMDKYKCDQDLVIALDHMEKRKRRMERLLAGKIDLAEHQFLLRHQRLCREIARLFPGYAFFLDTGTGKTVTGLQIIRDNLGIKWLIICPKSVIRSGWLEDQNTFYPELHLLPLSKNIKIDDYLRIGKQWEIKVPHRASRNTAIGMLAPWAQAYVINPESFKGMEKWFLGAGVTGLIFDESVLIKESTSQITKAVLDFSEQMVKRYIMSGLPAPNSKLEYFPQMQVVDKAVFGDSYYSFRQRYFEPAGFKGYKWKEKPEREQEFMDRLGERAIFIAKEDCLDLPEKTYMIRDVDLSTKALAYYQEMEKERVLELKDVKIITKHLLVNYMKLRQITSGFVLSPVNEDGHHLHDDKLKELLSVLDEIGNKQVIIWGNFRNEIKTIEQALLDRGKTVVTAFSETKDTDDSVARFKSGEAQYMVAHPKTLKYGVTFTRCTYAVYYSLSYSYDDYYQSHDRIYRYGQTQPCTFIFLLAPDTIDTVIYEALQTKAELSDVIKKHIKARGM